ncbi:hypothetical protein BGZ94_009614 [Podila epigama]|nr:hypothetical protein BGZ94_009614 [Podila epigama]
MKLSLAAAVGLLALTMTEAVKVNPLPAPVSIHWANSGPVKIDNNFRIVGPKHEILTKAFARTAKLIKNERWTPVTWEQAIPEFPPFPITKRADTEEEDFGAFKNNGSKATVKTIEVKVEDLKSDLQHGVDETYSLEITAKGKGTIKAKTVWGALHALNTLNQIIISDGKKGLKIEQPVKIKDGPQYPHRGIMYDTGRNFYPVKDLEKQIDALVWAKVKVFHWHVTDSQSWPIEVKKYPQMIKDAYSAKEVYTQKDVLHLVRYGRERGVRVLPEIDMPGHSAAGWLQIDKKAVTCAESWWDNDGWTHHSAVQPNPGQLDISYEPTYKLIKDVYKEMTKLFSENIFHVGSDELQTYCYNYSSSAMKWLKDRPGSTYSDLAEHYLKKALPIYQDKPSRRLMMWEDVLLGHGMPVDPKSIPKNTILQAWNGGVANIKALTSKGFDVPPAVPQAVLDAIAANPSANYLASNNYGGFGASWCGPYKTWQRIYDYDFTKGLTKKEAKHVIGGELAMWSEQADPVNVDGKVWPRSAAFAESLWSGNRNAEGYKRTTELSHRILEYRERLVARGVAAAALMPKYCLQHPHHCDLFRDQKALGK